VQLHSAHLMAARAAAAVTRTPGYTGAVDTGVCAATGRAAAARSVRVPLLCPRLLQCRKRVLSDNLRGQHRARVPAPRPARCVAALQRETTLLDDQESNDSGVRCVLLHNTFS
jgi:hypothetical protein